MAYSTETTLKTKVEALRINLWGDKDGDGTADATAITSAVNEAKETILEYVQPRYGSTITDTWDTTTPGWVLAVSDWLALYSLMSGSNVSHPIVDAKFEECIGKLERVRDYQAMIPGVTFTSGQTNEASSSLLSESSLSDGCEYDYDDSGCGWYE